MATYQDSGVTVPFALADARYAFADVSGRPTLLVRRADGVPVVVVNIEVDGARIWTIWAIGNPDKLTAV